MGLLTNFFAIIAIYALLGLLFGVIYALRIAPTRDPVAAAAPLRVRCLFIFGAAALWPLLLVQTNPNQGTRANSHEDNGTHS